MERFDLFDWGNPKVVFGPDLPMFHFKVDKVNYSVTDLRMLNEAALNALGEIISVVKSNPCVQEVSLNFDIHTSNSTLKIISDILLGMEYKAEKKGRGGFLRLGNFLVSGIQTEITKECKTMKVELISDHVTAIHEYLQSHDQLNLCELIVELAKRSLRLVEELYGRSAE